ncbi:MAG TPA: crosslink repair DNA glycosylase YcaQ family protein [Actinomycetota bacterium]|nr:crosslink repair DNA glycosylase YcaQ family protein [Actinomycetota bacterium]
MPPALRTLDPALARRLVLSRQRLAGPPPVGPGPEAIMEVATDLASLQLDPISVVARSHQLVLWSRLGRYDLADLDGLLWRERRLFEYWAHAAAIVCTDDYPIHSLLMRRYPSARHAQLRAWLADNQALRRSILRQLRAGGPLPTRALEDRAATEWQSSGWTQGRNVDRMLDLLWTQGRIMVAGRQGQQRIWDLAERCLPPWAPTRRPPEREVVRLSAQRSLRALGVATARDIDRSFTAGRYPGLPSVLAGLQRSGQVEQVRLVADGAERPGPWFVHADDLPLLDRLESGDWRPRTTLLSPFDNLIINRERTERLFGFSFRMEIYVPKAARRYGYYVLPILHGDRLIGRVDPALDRATGRLVVHAIHPEPGAPASAGPAVAAALGELAGFVGATGLDLRQPPPEVWRTGFA